MNACAAAALRKFWAFEAPKAPEALESGEFNAAATNIPRLGPAPELLPAVFARTTTGPLDKVYTSGEAFVVATVTERQQPSDSEFDQQKEQLRADAREAKQIEVRQQFLKTLREQGKVVTNQAAIDEVLGPAT